MTDFRSLFCQTFRATIPDRCQPPHRELCAKILQHGWQRGLISWPEWSDADVASAALLLDDLQNQQLEQALSQEQATRAYRRKQLRVSGELTAHMNCPWTGLGECLTRLQPGNASLEALTELVADATEPYITLFARLLGLWPWSDVRPWLRVQPQDSISLVDLHLIAVVNCVTAGGPLTMDHLPGRFLLPGRVLFNLYSELRSIAPVGMPEWWTSIPAQEQNLIKALYALPSNPRFVFASVIWGGLRLGEIAAFGSERGVRVDVFDVFSDLRNAWEKILLIL